MNPSALDALFLATSLVYGVSSVLFIAHLMGNAAAARVPTVAPRLLAVGVILHAVHINAASFVFQACPVKGVHFAMSFIAMIACMAYLAVRLRFRIDAVGAVIAPLALTFFLASRFVGGVDAAPTERVQSLILPIHIVVNLMGEALFSLAFATAVLYLIQENRLKRKKLEGLFLRLPPLESLDRAEHRFLLCGFPLLTVGIVTGTLWAHKVEAGNAADVWRAVFGYASWLLFAAVLLLRAAAGWRGRRAAYGTIAGFGFAVIVLLIYLFRGSAPAPTTVAVAQLATEVARPRGVR